MEVHRGNDWGGYFRLYEVGTCIGCGRTTKVAVYDNGDTSTDPRGQSGDYAADLIEPEGYLDAHEGLTPVMACSTCMNTYGSYKAVVNRAKRVWLEEAMERDVEGDEA